IARRAAQVTNTWYSRSESGMPLATSKFYFYSTPPRGFFSLNTVVKKGNSIGVKVNTNTTAGTTIVYAALVCHLLEDLDT
ncbi:MAG: hypothetical protein ACPG3T_06070, partial [Pseudomonadales bacterium]